MQSLSSRVPDIETLLALEPEELGAELLLLLKDEPGQQGMVILSNSLTALVAGYPAERSEAAMDAIAEAWAWLESNALLIPARNQLGSAPWRVLSRRARSFAAAEDFTALRVSALLSRELLHPSIPAQVWPNFVKGDYDTAVFQAMRQVEIALRTASGIKDEPSGVRVARRAFHPESGSLTDTHADGGERQAMADLFAGALGVLKNPQSHRNVDMDEPADAAAAILLASYLLRIIDTRLRALGRFPQGAT